MRGPTIADLERSIKNLDDVAASIGNRPVGAMALANNLMLRMQTMVLLNSLRSQKKIEKILATVNKLEKSVKKK